MSRTSARRVLEVGLPAGPSRPIEHCPSTGHCTSMDAWEYGWKMHYGHHSLQCSVQTEDLKYALRSSRYGSCHGAPL